MCVRERETEGERERERERKDLLCNLIIHSRQFFICLEYVKINSMNDLTTFHFQMSLKFGPALHCVELSSVLLHSKNRTTQVMSAEFYYLKKLPDQCPNS